MRYAIAISLLLTALLLLWLFIPTDSGISEISVTEEHQQKRQETSRLTTRDQSTEAMPAIDETFAVDFSDMVDAEVAAAANLSIHGYLYTHDPNIDVAGLTLSLVSQYAQEPDAASGRTRQKITDAEGRFEFDNLFQGTYQIHLKAQGLALSQNAFNFIMLQPDQETPEQALEVIAGGAISGVVFNKDTNEPIPGQYIAALLRTNTSPVPLPIYLSERSNVDGEYRIDHLPPGSFQMYHIDIKPQQLHLIPVEQFAHHVIMGETLGSRFEGQRPTAAQPIYADVKAGETTENVNVPVEVFPNASVSGIVLMPDMTPAANTNVTLQSIEQIPMPHSQAVTDAEGFFLFESVQTSHSYQITASKDNAQVFGVIEMLAETDIHGLELVLQIRGKISGVVVNPNDEPYAGLALWLSNTRLAIQDPIDSRTHVGSTITGEDGSFQWDMLEPGEYYLYVYNQHGNPIHAIAELATIKIAENESQEGLRLVFRPPASSIVGRVINTNREPVAVAQIFAKTQTTEVERQIWTMSSEQGNFILLAEEGYSYFITCNKSPFAIAERDQVYAGTKNLEIVMDDGLTLRGQVLNARTGEPITNYKLHASSLHNPRTTTGLGGIAIHGEQNAEYNYQTMTPIIVSPASGSLPEGRFEIHGVSKNVLLQIMNTDGFYNYSEVFENLTPASAAQEIVIRLKEASYLEGKVMDRNRRPIANAAVTFGDPDRPDLILIGGIETVMNRSDTTYTDAAGFFRLQILNEHGTPGLVASHKDYLPAGIPIPASTQAQRNLQIVLDAGGSIEGRITKEGKPLAGVLMIYQPSGEMMETLDMTSQYIEPSHTDDSGYYAIKNLPTSSGLVIIHMNVPGNMSAGIQHRQPHMVEVEVVAGYVTRLDFEIPVEDAEIYGTIRIADGAIPSLANIQVQITGEDGSMARSHTTQMQPDGTYELTELPAGSARLTVSARIEAPDAHGSLQDDARQFQQPLIQESDNLELQHGSRVQRDFVLSQDNEIQFILSQSQPEGLTWEILLFEGQQSQDDISNFMSSLGSGDLQPVGLASSYEGHMVYNLKPGTYTAAVMEVDMAAARSIGDRYIPAVRAVSQFTIRDNQNTGSYEIPLKF